MVRLGGDRLPDVFLQPHNVCVVAVFGPQEVPRVPRFRVQEECVPTLLICESGQYLRQPDSGFSITAAFWSSWRTDNVFLCTYDDEPERLQLLDELFSKIVARAFLITQGNVELDGVALNAAGAHLHEKGADLLQADLALKSEEKLYFSFGDYLRYRSDIEDGNHSKDYLPASLENIIFSHSVASKYCKELSSIPSIDIFHRLFQLVLIAEYGLPEKSSFVIGYRDISEDMSQLPFLLYSGGQLIWDNKVESHKFFEKSKQLIDLYYSTILKSERRERRLLLALFAVHFSDFVATIKPFLNATDHGEWDIVGSYPEGYAALQKLVANAVEVEDRLISFSCQIADRLELANCTSLEIDSTVFRCNLGRAIHQCIIQGRFDSVKNCMEPLFSLLDWDRIRGPETTNPSPDDWAWLAYSLYRNIADNDQSDGHDSNDTLKKSENLIKAMRAHEKEAKLARRRLAQENEGQISEYDLEWATLKYNPLSRRAFVARYVIEAIFQPGRNTFLLPFRIAWLSWSRLTSRKPMGSE